MRIFNRWRVVTIEYCNADRTEEWHRYMSYYPHMTYKGAVREKNRLEHRDTMENRFYREHIIVRSGNK